MLKSNTMLHCCAQLTSSKSYDEEVHNYEVGLCIGHNISFKQNTLLPIFGARHQWVVGHQVQTLVMTPTLPPVLDICMPSIPQARQ